MKIKLILAALAVLSVLPLNAGKPLSGKPVIGISASHSSSGNNSVGDSYVCSVERAGGIPLIIPMNTDSLQLEKIVSMIDGLVLTGGEDVNPARYGTKPIPQLGGVNEPRDTFDLMLARIAVRAGRPVLGICRGEQVLNVALGGTLWQDIPTEIENNLAHKQTDKRTVPVQEVSIAPDSYFRTIVGTEVLGVNTLHHQAVRDAAPGLTIVGRTSDGVVEIFEGFPMAVKRAGETVTFPQVIGVQFHPEAFAIDGKQPYLSVFQNLIFRASITSPKTCRPKK